MSFHFEMGSVFPFAVDFALVYFMIDLTCLYYADKKVFYSTAGNNASVHRKKKKSNNT